MSSNKVNNEKELIERITEGDEDAFADFFFRKIIHLRSAISKLTRHETNTEEILQETFIKVWLNRDKLAEIDNIDGYIYKIAFYEYQIYLRKIIAARKREVLWHNGQKETDNSLSENIKTLELRELIQCGINQLPSQRRLIYQMSRDQGKTNDEIAQILGISPQTVKNSLVIALKSIRDFLNIAGYTLSLTLWNYLTNS